MTWKIVSIVLPSDDEGTLQHLSSVPHSWTVNHEHSNCRNDLLVCHAAAHEYGASGEADGSKQHQHFLD